MGTITAGVSANAIFNSPRLDVQDLQNLAGIYTVLSNSWYEQTYESPNNETFFSVTNQDQMVLPSSESSGNWTPFQEGNQSNLAVKFGGRMLRQMAVKADIRLVPLALQWGSYMRAAERENRLTGRFLSYEEYILGLLMRQLRHDMEVNLKWTGRAKGMIKGAPSGSGDAIDGFRTILLKEAEAKKVPTIVGKKLDLVTAADEVRREMDMIANTPALAMKDYILYTSLQHANLVRRSYNHHHGRDTLAVDHVGMTSLPDHPNFKIVPQAGLKGQARVYTPKDNFVIGVQGAPEMTLEYRSYVLFASFLQGIGFQIADIRNVFINNYL